VAGQNWEPGTHDTLTRLFADHRVSACAAIPACSAIDGGLPRPWPKGEVVAYHDDHLSGLRAIQPDVGAPSAFAAAKKQMDKSVEQDCRKKIGGEFQEFYVKSTDYWQTTYALILLPMWFVSYECQGKTWNVVIDGYAGNVNGRRPYSAAAKVSLAVFVLAILIAVAVLWLLR
jgi:hypothetical protein